MAVDWLAIRNDYINGGGSYRKLAEKYGVSFSALEKKARAENWKEEKETQCDKIATELRQKTADAIVQKGVDWVERLLSISDNLIGKIERAVGELDLAQVTNKTKTRVIEYKNRDRPDKPTREITEEKEEILAVSSIVDRKGLQQVAAALKTIWDISNESNGEIKSGETREDDPLTKALKEMAEGMNDADQ